jgi:succinoglycan biosynthesis transport protein ExoP
VVELGSGAVWDTREYYETQYQILQSRRVSLRVVRDLGLNRDPSFVRNLPPDAPTPPEFEPISEEDAADMLRGRIRVEPVKLSRIAMVRLQDADPERAARMLKAIVETYRDLNVETAVESGDDAAEWLRSEHDKLKGELEASELALHQYKEDKNILDVAFDAKSNMLREEIEQLNQALTSIRTRREELSARRAQLAKVRPDDPSVLPATELLSSGLLQSLRTQYVQALRDHQSLLRGGLGKNHPEVQAADARVSTTRDALLAEVRNIQGALDSDLGAIQRQESGVASLFERAKTSALELNRLEIEFNRLRRSKEHTEKIYALLLERSKESDLTRRLRVNNVSVVDDPVVPRAPVKPNVPLNIAGGVALGLVLGASTAIGRGKLDRTIKTPDDVEYALRATFLGLLPQIEASTAKGPRRTKIDLSQPELIVHHSPMSGIAEAARSIRTNLMFMAPDKPYKTLLITSAGPSEGKTTVAACVATAMAQAGKRVLILDCDLRRPRVHRIFRPRGADVGPGLTGALLDDAQDPVQSTPVPNLFYIPAGAIPPNPSELLHSERFRAFLTKMQGQFDQIILDSPPVVAVTDAVVLSTIVDGTVVVVRAYKTLKDLAKHGLRQLADVGATVAGVVLNSVDMQRDEYQYAYHYYRRDAYYSLPQNEAQSTSGEASTSAPSTQGSSSESPRREGRGSRRRGSSTAASSSSAASSSTSPTPGDSEPRDS